MIGKNGYFTSQNLFGFDPWEFTYIGIVGGRGIGKSFDIQNVVLDDVLYNKNEFAWIRVNPTALKITKQEFPDALHKERIHSQLGFKGNKFTVNGKVKGHFYALSQAHNIKGGTVDWRKIRYIVFDEFNTEQTERKYFDITDAFISIIETIARPALRIRARERGEKVLPLTIIFMANDTQEGSDVLERFNFIPDKYGRYILPRKKLVLEYVEDSGEWKELREKSPLAVLRKKSDKQLGESTVNIKIDTIRMGDLVNVKHLYRLWISLDKVVDVFSHREGLWISGDFDSRTILRMHGYSSYVVRPEHLRANRIYRSKLIDNLKALMYTGNVKFANPLVGRLVINSLFKK